ncbi:Replication protein O [Cytobacillus spongiae]|uniref:Replication protein O n=1 Tax=Cytobacillus spongiae TaxID=2901381 RepID=UPI001F23C8D4|nr:Replication protein O [Cytobacillus spongiae]UII56244.1 Replication protein O [Cytobacillus spongiae]
MDLLMMVNHEDKKAVLGNEMIEVKRGQRITSIRKLCDKWSWSNTKVTQFLNLLQNDGMIYLKSDTKKTVITIANYDSYQSREEGKTIQNRRDNSTKQTEKRTNKNNKELKNDKEVKSPSCRKPEIYDEDSIPFQLSLKLFNNIRKNNSGFKQPNLQKWSDEFRLMMERDNRTEYQIAHLIDWCQQDSFWKANILSPSKLRKQYDQLVLKIQSEEQTKQNKSPQQFSLDRPNHWKEPKPLTKEEISKLRKMENELPY